MSTNPNTSAVFEAFIEASNALAELPKVRADLMAAEELLAVTAHSLTEAETNVADRDTEIANLRAALAQKEAELSDATFRADNASKTLDQLRGVLGVPVAPDAGSVDPVVPSATTDETFTVTFTSDPEPILQWQHFQQTPDPTPVHTNIPPSPIAHTTDAVSSEAANTSTTTSTETQTLSADPTSMTTENSTPTGEMFAPPATDATTFVDPKPYTDAPYWDKPSDMTWAEFSNLGGKVPYWVIDAQTA